MGCNRRALPAQSARQMPLLHHGLQLAVELGNRVLDPVPYGRGPGKANLGPKVFFIWGAFCGLAIVFTYTMIYETKALTLEQVDELYDVVDKAWKSKQFRPAVRYAEMEHGGLEGEAGRKMSIREHVEHQERRRASVVEGGEKVV